MKYKGEQLPTERRSTDGIRVRPWASKFAAENEAAKVVAATYKDASDPFVHFDTVFPTTEGGLNRTATLVAFLFDIGYKGGEIREVGNEPDDITAFGKDLAEP